MNTANNNYCNLEKYPDVNEIYKENSCVYVEDLLLKPSVKDYFSKILNHKRLIEDSRRLSLYREAIHKIVSKGDIVYDIGAGTGILSEFAIDAGAKTVYLIEENKTILDLARQKMAKKGLLRYCKFISLRSTNLLTEELPEKADIIISETIGTVAFNEGILETLFDARRFLTERGKFLPKRIILRAGLYSTTHPELDIVNYAHVIRQSEADTVMIGETYKAVEADFTSGTIHSHTVYLNLKGFTNVKGIAFYPEIFLNEDVVLKTWPGDRKCSWGIACFPINIQNKLSHTLLRCEISHSIKEKKIAVGEKHYGISVNGNNWYISQPLDSNRIVNISIVLNFY